MKGPNKRVYRLLGKKTFYESDFRKYSSGVVQTLEGINVVHLDFSDSPRYSSGYYHKICFEAIENQLQEVKLDVMLKIQSAQNCLICHNPIRNRFGASIEGFLCGIVFGNRNHEGLYHVACANEHIQKTKHNHNCWLCGYELAALDVAKRNFFHSHCLARLKKDSRYNRK